MQRVLGSYSESSLAQKQNQLEWNIHVATVAAKPRKEERPKEEGWAWSTVHRQACKMKTANNRLVLVPANNRLVLLLHFLPTGAT